MSADTQVARSSPRPGARWILGRIRKKGLRPRYAAYIIIAAWTAAIIIFGIVERLVDPDTFSSIWLGIWWATQTVTTVGYGDTIPHQTAGKAIAIILMLGGLSFLAVLTGAITSVFVTHAMEENQESGEDPVLNRLEELGDQMEAIRSDLSRLEQDRKTSG